MSFIVKGVDLPIETDYLRLALLRSGRDNEVLVFDDVTNTLIGEAIQIPKGARLIDADALFKDLKEQQIPFNSDINSAIIVAPTIFESEEE